jgi:hypothetical protein
MRLPRLFALGAATVLAMTPVCVSAAPALPFPADDGAVFQDAALRQRLFPSATVKAFGDASYAVSLAVPAGWQAIDPDAKVPMPGGAPATMRLFRSPEGAAAGEIELQVSRLPQEMTANDWLDIAVAETKLTPVASRMRVGPTGPVVDRLLRAGTGPNALVVRLFAVKDGDRLYLLSCRATESRYASQAEAFALAISTFHPLRPTGNVYAEDLLHYKVGAPGRPTFGHLASWRASAPQGDLAPGINGASFKLLGPGPGNKGQQLVGLITVKVIQKAENPGLSPDSLVTFMRDDLTAAGVTLGPTEGLADFRTEAMPLAGKVARAAGRRSENAVEFRGVVLQNESSWYTLSLIGPAQASNPAGFAVTRRALEVMALEAHSGR